MKTWLRPLIGLTLALAITGTITGFTLANGGTGTPEQDPTATSIDDIDPKVCNAIHNINAYTPKSWRSWESALTGPGQKTTLPRTT